MSRHTTCWMIMVLALSLGWSAGTPSAADSETVVRAKIGIQVLSGDRIERAKSCDRLKAGDMLRIYVHPERGCYVYVVHSDQQTATLLNTVEQRIQGSTLVMPSLHQYYQVDGKSPVETFAIICSPKELTDISDIMKNGEASHAVWASLADDLSAKSRIDLTQDSERPFAIAGNVRGAGGQSPAAGDPFSERLQIFSGRSLLIKRYEFRVHP
ncbi:MAG: hypothetical protein ACQET7_04460 [Thermodesulfobacteriota bacterium]